LFDILPGNGAGLFLQPRSPQGVIAAGTEDLRPGIREPCLWAHCFRSILYY